MNSHHSLSLHTGGHNNICELHFHGTILNCKFLSVWLHHYLFNKHGSCFHFFFYPHKQCLSKMPTREPLPLERNPEKRPCWLSGPACTKGQGHGLYWFTGPRLPSVCGTQTVVTTVSSTAPCKAVGLGLRCRHSQSIQQLLDPRGSSPSRAGLQPPTEGHWTAGSR